MVLDTCLINDENTFEIQLEDGQLPGNWNLENYQLWDLIRDTYSVFWCYKISKENFGKIKSELEDYYCTSCGGDEEDCKHYQKVFDNMKFVKELRAFIKNEVRGNPDYILYKNHILSVIQL